MRIELSVRSNDPAFSRGYLTPGMNHFALSTNQWH
jgi:hypothetical protein